MNRRKEPQFGYERTPRQEDIYVDPAAERRGRRKSRRSLLPVMVSGSAIILFAGFIWIAYTHHAHLRPGETPVIKADAGPVKVKPDDPGGMDIPFQDTTVYDELGGSKTQRNTGAVEHLLQPPEQPMEKPEAAVPQPEAKIAEDTPPAAALSDAGNATSPPAPQAAPAASNPPTPNPDTVLAPPPPSTNARTLPPAPDTSLLPPPPPPSKPAHQVVPPAPFMPKTETLAQPSTGNFAVQLGAFRDEPTANAEWQRLKTAHPNELGSLSPIIERADLGEKGIWYRLKAGPVAEDTAKQTCDTLKSANVTCFAAPR